MSNNVTLRRFIAVAIDSLYFLPGAIFFALFNDLIVISLIIMFATFVSRDVISERSFGKRVMELCIIDKNTGKPASKKQRTIRNLFFIIGSVDAFVLLIKGESIGDIVSDTIIVCS